MISISAPSCCTHWNLAKEGWAVRGLFPHVLLYTRACQTQFTNGSEVWPRANKVRARPPWIYRLPPWLAWRVYWVLFNGTFLIILLLLIIIILLYSYSYFLERPEFKLAPFQVTKLDHYTDLCLTLCHMNLHDLCDFHAIPPKSTGGWLQSTPIHASNMSPNKTI